MEAKNSHVWAYIKLFFAILVGFTIYNIAPPTGMEEKGWHLFAIFFATIFTIILKPFPIGAVALMGLCACILTNTLTIAEALSGFSSYVVWLVVFVFFIARGFIKSHLGARIGYYFIKILGGHSIGLAYGITLTELFVSPLIPSNSARAGGIVYPIIKAISESLGSYPNSPTSRRIGSYLTQVSYHANVTTSAMFLTAMAANPMVQEIALKSGINVTWTNWFMGAIIPGFISLMLMPLVIYFLHKPSLTKIDHAKDLAEQKLSELGNIKLDEWLVMGIFSMMLVFWIFADLIGIHPTTTGLIGVVLLLLTRVITFDDALKEKEAWHILLWFSILVSLAKFLQQFGFIGWFSETMQGMFVGMQWQYAFIGLVLIYYYSHYMFASNTAHISAMYALFLTVALGAGTPGLLAVLVLGYTSNLFAHTTHYGTSSAAVLFGAGYVQVSHWWMIGFCMSIHTILIWGIIGGAWWRMLGWW